MANKLVKLELVVTGGGDAPGGSGSVDVDGNPVGGLPPQGSRCYLDIEAELYRRYPDFRAVYVTPDRGTPYFRLSNQGDEYVYAVRGACVNGSMVLSYQLLRQPGGIGSDV